MSNNYDILEKDAYYSIIFNKFQEHGYVTNSFVEDTILSFDIPLTEIESVYNNILDNGILIVSSQKDIEKYSIDYGFYDYNKMYQEIVNIEPNLKPYITKVKNIHPPQWHEFDNCFIRAKNGNIIARERIIKMYLRVAVKQAYYYFTKYAFPLEDAIQEANRGLVEGYEIFDNGKTLKFQNHIQWYIRTALDRKLKVGNNYITYPAHIKEKLVKINSLFRNKTEKYKLDNKDKLLKKVATLIKCDKNKALKYLKCFLNFLNIDYPYLDGTNFLSDHYEVMTLLDENITNDLLKRQLSNILSTLPFREADIIKMRFGIDIERPLVLEELAEKYNLTRERIRQIESKALRRLRHPKRSSCLKNFFENDVRELTDTELPKEEKFIEK
jgi:RNA polymerase primary sigma factor